MRLNRLSATIVGSLIMTLTAAVAVAAPMQQSQMPDHAVVGYVPAAPAPLMTVVPLDADKVDPGIVLGYIMTQFGVATDKQFGPTTNLPNVPEILMGQGTARLIVTMHPDAFALMMMTSDPLALRMWQKKPAPTNVLMDPTATPQPTTVARWVDWWGTAVPTNLPAPNVVALIIWHPKSVAPDNPLAPTTGNVAATVDHKKGATAMFFGQRTNTTATQPVAFIHSPAAHGIGAKTTVNHRKKDAAANGNQQAHAAQGFGTVNTCPTA